MARGETGQGKAGMVRARTFFGTPGMGKKHRQVVAGGGWERCPGGWLLCDWTRDRGGKKRLQIEKEVVLTRKILGAIGGRSGGKDKWNG